MCPCVPCVHFVSSFVFSTEVFDNPFFNKKSQLKSTVKNYFEVETFDPNVKFWCFF
jgi:hypothetical protein